MTKREYPDWMYQFQPNDYQRLVNEARYIINAMLKTEGKELATAVRRAKKFLKETKV